ncbi:MAG TPA: hypothetical protein VD887_13750 [Allosphingosinicella sp.]|nr:hypothetical protein [Allosphingosinicella sp.]
MDDDLEEELPSDHEDEAQNQEDVEEEKSHWDPTQQARSQEVSAAADVAVQQLSAVADQEQIDLEAQLPNGDVDNPFEADAPDPGRVTAEQIRTIIREELRRVAPQETVLNNLKVRYLFAVFGIIGAVNAMLALIKAGAGAHAELEDEAASNSFPALNTPEAQKVIEAWRLGDDETAFWGLFSSFVSNNAPRSFPEQLVFMQITENLAYRLMSSTWQWTSAQDKVDLIKQLSASIAGHGLAATYTLLPALTYKGRALPRAIAANLMSYALADWMRSRRLDRGQ